MLFILGILLKLPLFFHSLPVVIKNNDGFLYTGLISFLKPLANNAPIVYAVVAFAFIFMHAYILSGFINYGRLIHRPNFLCGMAYMLTSSLIGVFNYLSSSLVASLFLLWSLISIFRTHNPKSSNKPIFNAGLLVSIASMFFPPAIIFIIWVFLALAFLKPFKLSQWVLLLLGATAPYYFYIIYLYLSNQFSVPPYILLQTLHITSLKLNYWYAGALFLLLAPLLVGVYYVQSSSAKIMVHVRKTWYLLLCYLIISIFIALFNMGITLENWVIILIPVSAFHGFGYFNAELKIYPKITFWVTVTFIIAMQLFSKLW